MTRKQTPFQRAAKTEIRRIVERDYGVGLAGADPTTILWAAETIAHSGKTPQAKRELEIVNRFRERLGLPLCYPPFGHICF